jgi:Zn-dependent protease
MGDLQETISKIIILAPLVLLAVTVHELAHGYAAFLLGDRTAKAAGRLTLNPFKHLDLVGTLVFFITQMIGWAKPVPVNPYNFRNPRKDMIWVSLAGPGANLALAVVLSLVFHFLGSLKIGSDFQWAFKTLETLYLMAYIGVSINIGLAVFNLLPIPPLDGSHVLEGLLPREMAMAYERIKPYGFFILLALIFLGVTSRIIYPIIMWLRGILL